MQGQLNITVITTGGTIEKTYDERTGNLTNRPIHATKALFKKLRLPYLKATFLPILFKDSLFMTEKDRQFIYKTVKSHLDTPILVVHGTDTMVESAKYIQMHLGKISYPIIFTGAFIPMGLADTDALQNVSESLILLRVLKAGIYISMHGNYYEIPYVIKNKKIGTFEYYSSKNSILSS